MINLQLSLLATATLMRLCAGQASGWELDQGSTTMCYWTTPRAAVIRDTLYVDGGLLWWQSVLKNGSLGSQIGDGNPLGLVYTLNFSTPFKTSDNISDIMQTISKAPAGGAANNIAPNYVDGGMFANDYEWITYGGLVSLTDDYSAQGADAAALYGAYGTGVAGQQFTPGYKNLKLTPPATRYLTYGAAASSPSENLGFYFGGLRSASGGSIVQSPPRRLANMSADVDSRTFIQVDMSGTLPTWTNTSLPTIVPGRASAELVWVPVSAKGILVAVGGATHPSYANINFTNTPELNAISKEQSPQFLTTVSVYDVASNNWYEQETTNAPPGALAQGCSVVASAPDGSSHNIYWYGGFDGISPTSDFNDDVWVLSLPSFIWTKVTPGTVTHARAGHKCVKPYPDQMIVIGGYAPLGSLPKCVEDGIIQIYNLSSTEWVDSYNPTVWSDYQVPASIVDKIGGTGKGGAIVTAPAKGFTNSSLGTVFGSKYDASKTKTWYPYALKEPKPNNTGSAPLPSPTQKPGSGTPSYLAPVLAVVLGLFFITLIILAVLLWRRRRVMTQGNGTQSEAGTMDSRFWVANWLRGTPNPDHKGAPTVTTDQTDETYPTSPYDFDNDRPDMQEVGGNQVHEMMDTSRPAEIDTGTGFVALGQRQKPRRGPSTTSHSSSVSQESNPNRLPVSPMNAPRPDSPSLGDPRITSGVSDVSHTDRGHLRGISETSVSTDGGGNYAAVPASQQQAIPEVHEESEAKRRPGVVSPMTPPDMVNISNDYMGARGTPATSSTRRSNFAEKLDEVKK